MARTRVRDIIDAFMETDDLARKIDTSNYASPRCAYYSFIKCIKSKCIKGCFMYLHKGTVYLIKE